MASVSIKVKSHSARTPWLKRAGLMGFAFFLAKGLLWLGVAAAAVWQGVGH